MYEIRVESTAEPGFNLVTVAGPIDIYTVGRLRDELLRLDAAGVRAIVVDLRMIEYIDSTGLGMLIGALKRAFARHGFLDLVLAEHRYLRIFEQTGLTKVFRIHDTLEEARAFRNPAPLKADAR